jgi:hypothetical protein
VLQHPETLSNPALYAERPRICDLGYLREVYTKADESLGYRCPSEIVSDYVRKGGDEAATNGRKCLCNTLLATVGLGQQSSTHAEPPLITAGHDVSNLARFLPKDGHGYSAADVIRTTLASA